MKKVGIMSMQRVANYGSFLQAYALKQIIEELGCSVEFVDYHVGKTLIEEKKSILGQKVHKALNYLIGDGRFIDRINFINHKRLFIKNYGDYLGISDVENFNPILDVLLIGSDEVFNCIQSNPNVGFSLELFGANNKAKRLISYAASFGNTTIEKLMKYKVDEEVKKNLNNFDYLSVRDKNSISIVKTLINKTPSYHIDPVLLYDYMKDCKKIPDKVDEENYIILYAYPGRINKEENEIIKAYAKAHNKKIICFGGVQKCCDKFIDCSPFEVLSYFKNADGIITDTFHGTIFSIINNKKFITLVRKSQGSSYGNEEKLTDLLTRLKLDKRIQYDLRNLDKLLSENIDYSDTNDIIKVERSKAKAYLADSIMKGWKSE